jgi:hypothetical protein
MLLHLKEIKMPSSFTARDVSGIQVLLNLILTSAKLHGGAVVTLVHIFINVLDRFDGGDGLHIDMAAILPDEESRVTDYPAIVDMLPFDEVSLASVGVPGACIIIFSNRSMLPKRLGEAFRAFAINHARCLGVLSAARIVNHV